MEIFIAVLTVVAAGFIGLGVWAAYNNAKVQRDREERERAKYGTVSAATLEARNRPMSTGRSAGQSGSASTPTVETKSVTLQMRERVGALGMKPSADAAKLEKLIADGWEIVTQTQAPHGARLTTYVLRRSR